MNLGVKKGESKKNYCSVFSFVLLKYCTKRLKMCKNRLYFAVKCPFRSQNSLIIKQLQAKHTTPPTFEELTPHPAYSQNFFYFFILLLSLILCIKNIVFCVIFACFLGLKLSIFRDLKIRVFVLEVLGCFYELKFGYFKRCEVIFLHVRIFV